LSFILYYVVGMIGEKASVEGAVSSVLGMWSSTLVFLPIGLFLTIKATSDSSLLNSESWIKGLNKIRDFLTGHKFENK
jgi:lipopolysaccharide export system permease protein